MVTLTYTDAEGDLAQSAEVFNVAGGTITTPVDCNAGVCTVGLTPLPDSTADITADFTVNDGDLDSNTATITVTIGEVNDALVVAGIPDQTIEEGELTEDAIKDIQTAMREMKAGKGQPIEDVAKEFGVKL